MKHEPCGCGRCEKGDLPVNYNILLRTLQTVRVGGLLLTASEADNIARRILVDAATETLRKE